MKAILETATGGICIGRTDAEAEAPILWPPDAKNDSLEKTLMLSKTEGRRRRGRQRTRWLDGTTDSVHISFEQSSGYGEGQGSLACCSPWGRMGSKELGITERLN